MKRLTLIAVAVFALTARATDSPDLQMQTRIRQEGFRNSKVMEIAAGITDSIGARLTGSPNLKKANEWTRAKLEEFGLTNAHLESWDFGRGWSYELCSVRLLKPEVAQLWALPRAWTPSTAGPIRGVPIKVKLETKEDLEKHKGKLAGRIVIPAEPRELKPRDKADLVRYDADKLNEITQYQISQPRDRNAPDFAARRAWRRELIRFFEEEKVLAVIEQGSNDGGTFAVQGSSAYRADEPTGVPTIVMSAEHYARMSRLLDKKEDVEVEIDVRTRFHTDDLNAYNTIAEIPGSDRKSEVVMLGGHLDSWHGATGATDNAAGVAVAMEAARIIRAIGVTPRRTIRVGLWTGEEQGLLGSRAYVAKHFASRLDAGTQAERDASLSPRRVPFTIKPEHARLSAYFNLDNGTGKIRGVYAQENAAAFSVFQQWIRPLEDLGASAVTMRNTMSTDHIPFDEVGLPGFQFVQDNIEYNSRTHHTNYDTYERLQREDLMQAAVVVATFVWEAANRPDLMPRKPMPKDLPPAR